MNKLIGVVFLGIMGSPLWASDSVEVLEVRGDAAVRTGLKGKWLPLVKGIFLRPGQWIQTSFGARVYLKFWSNTVAQVRSASLVEIETVRQEGPKQTGRLRLALGSVRVKVRPDRREIVDFRVKSPGMTTAVKGTQWDHSYSAQTGRSELRVIDGTVWFLSSDVNLTRTFAEGSIRTSDSSTPRTRLSEKEEDSGENDGEQEGGSLSADYGTWNSMTDVTMNRFSSQDNREFQKRVADMTTGNDNGGSNTVIMQNNKPIK